MTKAFNTRLVFRTIGALLLIEALFMVISTLVGFYYNDPDKEAFIVSTILTLFGGGISLLIGKNAPRQVGEREGYVIVASVWVVLSIFGMLPYYLSGQIDNLTDAWFETMSGFSTTGTTILPQVEILTHAALFWRATTQWLGGMGVMVLCVALLPMFGLGGMQLYAAEVTGVSYEKISPRIADTAKRLWGLYIALTFIEAILLHLFGMPTLDAVCNSFCTIATGGFATYTNSLIDCNIAIQYTIAIFMLLSGINFSLLIYSIMGKPKRLLEDEETHWYIGAIVIVGVIFTICLFIHNTHITINWTGAEWSKVLPQLECAFRQGLFTTISVITTTGFAVADYSGWPHLLWVVVFFLMFTGAGSGSTSGGIKWVRIIVFAKSAIAEIKRRIHPNAVIPIKLNNHPLSHETISNVMAFMMFYICIIVVSVLIFSATGVNFEAALGTAVSAIGNFGVTIGQFGPDGSYVDFPAISKWWMTFVMLIGRLEIFTILLLFTSVLWKK